MRTLSKATPLTAAVILLAGFTAGGPLAVPAFANRITLAAVAALSDVGQVSFGAAVFDAVVSQYLPTCIHNQNAVANHGAATIGRPDVRLDFAVPGDSGRLHVLLRRPTPGGLQEPFGK